MSIFDNLAKTYPLLYICPGDDKQEEYRAVALRGEAPKARALSHFTGNENDNMWLEDTPAGPVLTISITNRLDFETFLRIMAYKCTLYPIPQNTGAMTISGIINWQKINAHKQEYLLNGGTDWSKEFASFTSNKLNYTDTIVVISTGPYSNIGAEKTGYSLEDWLNISSKIRIYHECTHVICKRLFPEKKDAVKDEIIADTVGLLGALGHLDKNLLCLFLGISDKGYLGGRLENYVDSKDNIDSIAKDSVAFIAEIEKTIADNPNKSPYEYLMLIMENIM